MIEDLRIAEPADIGYYSGMVDSSFSFAQLLTVRLHTFLYGRSLDFPDLVHFFLLNII